MNDDHVNHPPHYNDGAKTVLEDGTALYEPIKVIEDWGLGFCLGNALKYIIRAPHKGTEERDLKKALWYLERWIDTHAIQIDQHREFSLEAPAMIKPEDVAADWHIDPRGDLGSAIESIHDRDILAARALLRTALP